MQYLHGSRGKRTVSWMQYRRAIVTPTARAALAASGLTPAALLDRFCAADWGAVDSYGRSVCDFAVAHGLPVISWYVLPDDTAIAVVAPADRSAILVCLRAEHGPQEVSAAVGYAAWAPGYDIELNQLIIVEQPLVHRLVAAWPPATALDAATGTGRHALALARAGAVVTAFDSSRAMLAVARARMQAEEVDLALVQASLEQPLPFHSGAVQLVLCALAFCHLPDLLGPCREFFRVTQPGGRLLLTDFHPDAVAQGWRTDMWRGLSVYRLPNFGHGRDGYLAAVEKAGYRIRDVYDLPIGVIPPEASHGGLVQKWGWMNFCLVVDAEKR